MASGLGAKGRVLVVDDDASLAEMLTIVLRQEGFDSRVCARGDLALAEFRDYRPDLVLLDLMLPGKDGIDVCKEIRAESGVPIVMLTAKGDTIDVVVGLESGADDYVVKPFKPKELVARIRARVRRLDAARPGVAWPSATSPSTWPGTRSPGTATPINLTPLEFDLLVCLARKPWQVFTREVLLEQVWGYRHAADTRLVNVHVQRLRSKVEHDPENPEIVVTVRGVGYKAGSALGPAAHDQQALLCRRRTPRPHLLASLDPGPGGGQHRAAVRPRVRGRRLVPAAADPRRSARQPGQGGAWRRPTRRPPKPSSDSQTCARHRRRSRSRQREQLVSPIIERGSHPRAATVVLTGPSATETCGLEAGGNRSSPSLAHLECPDCAAAALRGLEAATAWTFTGSAMTRSAATRVPGIVGRLQLIRCRPTGRSTPVLPLPA